MIPEKRMTILCAVFYLRLINPSLLSPSQFKIIEDENILTPQCTTNLVEVTKLFQYASNKAKFEKEPYLMFNGWLENNGNKFTDFLEEICKFDPNEIKGKRNSTDQILF